MLHDLRVVCCLAFVLAACSVVAKSVPNYRQVKNGILVGPLNDGSMIQVSYHNDNAFSLAYSPSSTSSAALFSSPMINPPREISSIDVIEEPENGFVVLRSHQAGFAKIDIDGRFILQNSKGEIVVRSEKLFTYESGPSSSLNHFSTNNATVYVSLLTTETSMFYGSGANKYTATSLDHRSGEAYVDNTGLGVPYHWSSDGYGMIVVSNDDTALGGPRGTKYPVSWTLDDTSSYDPFSLSSPSPTSSLNHPTVKWKIGVLKREPTDLAALTQFIIFPSPSLSNSVSQLWSITGAPRLPPLYALGFLACRWGWSDPSDTEKTLQLFRQGRYPLDGIIMDFEWYTNRTDYDIPYEGDDGYIDFGYNTLVFPSPMEQLKRYHDIYNVKFGGIRKPRLGNKALLKKVRQKGWVLQGKKDIDFSQPLAREWYKDEHKQFMSDGVDFFWNDEGEAAYFLYHGWNQAQLPLFTPIHSGIDKRLFTINRSYTLGIQRLGATAVWTGDVDSTWQSLRNTTGYLINWSLSGIALVTCDIGGFRNDKNDPLLLTRWYQLGVLMPLMRIHSRIDAKAHFPFIYDKPYADAMRKAVNLRYSLLPTIYSRISEAYYYLQPFTLPLAALFPNDKDSRCTHSTTQFMFGDNLMSVPVLNEDGIVNVYLPNGPLQYPTSHSESLSGRSLQSDTLSKGLLHLNPHAEKRIWWYRLDNSTLLTGGQSFTLRPNMDEQLIYVSAGSILLRSSSIPQHIGDISKEPLEIQVYTSPIEGDYIITLYEDDGISNAYTAADQEEKKKAIRCTVISARWTGISGEKVQVTHQRRSMSDTSNGNSNITNHKSHHKHDIYGMKDTPPHWFTEARVRVIYPGGQRISPVFSLDIDGTVIV